MWLAVCANQQCQWERGGFSRTSAETHLAWHTYETAHRGAAVDVPNSDVERRLELRRKDEWKRVA